VSFGVLFKCVYVREYPIRVAQYRRAISSFIPLMGRSARAPCFVILEWHVKLKAPHRIRVLPRQSVWTMEPEPFDGVDRVCVCVCV
jgi:hypothetical protein